MSRCRACTSRARPTPPQHLGAPGHGRVHLQRAGGGLGPVHEGVVGRHGGGLGADACPVGCQRVPGVHVGQLVVGLELRHHLLQVWGLALQSGPEFSPGSSAAVCPEIYEAPTTDRHCPRHEAAQGWTMGSSIPSWASRLRTTAAMWVQLVHSSKDSQGCVNVRAALRYLPGFVRPGVEGGEFGVGFHADQPLGVICYA